MSTTIKGDALVLYVHDGTEYEPIACLTSNTLSTATNIIESQTKCDPGEVIRQAGSFSYELGFEGEYIENEASKLSHDGILTIVNTATQATSTWRMDTGQTGTPYYYGTGIFTDTELSADAGDELATFSGTIQGSGLILTTDPIV
jgi:hypothetical protein